MAGFKQRSLSLQQIQSIPNNIDNNSLDIFYLSDGSIRAKASNGAEYRLDNVDSTLVDVSGQLYSLIQTVSGDLVVYIDSISGSLYNTFSTSIADVSASLGQQIITVDTNAVHKTGDEIIDGNKVFSDTTYFMDGIVIHGEVIDIETTQLKVKDNIISLSVGVTGVPFLDSGIEVIRGIYPTSQIIWNESYGFWTAGTSGSLEKIILQSDLNAALVNLSGGNFAVLQAKVDAISASVADVSANVNVLSSQIYSVSGTVNQLVINTQGITGGLTQLDSRFVNISGDSMFGPLNINSDLKVSNNVTIDSFAGKDDNILIVGPSGLIKSSILSISAVATTTDVYNLDVDLQYQIKNISSSISGNYYTKTQVDSITNSLTNTISSGYTSADADILSQVYNISAQQLNYVNGNFVTLGTTQTISGYKTFRNSSNNDVLSTYTSTLYDNNAIASVKWDNRGLYDSVGVDAVDWNNRLLVDQSLITSIDWNNRLLNSTWTASDLKISSLPASGAALVNFATWDATGKIIDSGFNTSNLLIPHNSTTSKQGGTTNEYYHLNAAQYNDYVGKSEVSNVSGALIVNEVDSYNCGGIEYYLGTGSGWSISSGSTVTVTGNSTLTTARLRTVTGTTSGFMALSDIVGNFTVGEILSSSVGKTVTVKAFKKKIIGLQKVTNSSNRDVVAHGLPYGMIESIKNSIASSNQLFWLGQNTDALFLSPSFNSDLVIEKNFTGNSVGSNQVRLGWEGSFGQLTIGGSTVLSLYGGSGVVTMPQRMNFTQNTQSTSKYDGGAIFACGVGISGNVFATNATFDTATVLNVTGGTDNIVIHNNSGRLLDSGISISTLATSASLASISGALENDLYNLDVDLQKQIYENKVNIESISGNVSILSSKVTTISASIISISGEFDSRLDIVEATNVAQTNSINTLFSTYANSTTVANISADLYNKWLLTPYGDNTRASVISDTSVGGSGANNLTRSSFFYDNNSQFGFVGINIQNGYSNDSQLQLATISGSSPELRARMRVAGVWQPAVKLWTDANDGSGSGLESDTVDGIHGYELALISTVAAISAGLDTRITNNDIINGYQTNSINTIFSTYANSTTVAAISAGLNSRDNNLQSQIDALVGVSGSYALDTNVVHKYGDETISGIKTFTSTISGNVDNTNLVLGATSSSIQIGGDSTGFINIAQGSSPTVINIGSAGDTVNIIGDLVVVKTINSEVMDKTLTLNVSGALGTSNYSGIYIEENSISGAGYARIDNNRSSWAFKAPVSNGAILLTPSAFADQITSSSTVDNFFTLPDKSGTFALVGDIPATSLVVHTTGNESIHGIKDFYYNSNNLSLSTSGSAFYDIANKKSLDWSNGYTYDNTGIISIDYNGRNLYGTNGFTTLNWSTKKLYDTNGYTSFDWGQRLAWYNNNSTIAIDFSSLETSINDVSGGKAFSTTRQLIDSTNITTVDWQNKNLNGQWSINGGVIIGNTCPVTYTSGVSSSVSGSSYVVDTVPVSANDAASWKIVISNGTQKKISNIDAIFTNSTIEYHEYGTQSIGDTSAVTLSCDINAGSARLLATASSGVWTIKYSKINF